MYMFYCTWQYLNNIFICLTFKCIHIRLVCIKGYLGILETTLPFSTYAGKLSPNHQISNIFGLTKILAGGSNFGQGKADESGVAVTGGCLTQHQRPEFAF